MRWLGGASMPGFARLALLLTLLPLAASATLVQLPMGGGGGGGGTVTYVRSTRSTAGGASNTGTFTHTATLTGFNAGDTLVGAVMWQLGTTGVSPNDCTSLGTITDTPGNTYTKRVTAQNLATQTVCLVLFDMIGAAAGSPTTVVAHFSTSGGSGVGYPQMFLDEYSGVVGVIGTAQAYQNNLTASSPNAIGTASGSFVTTGYSGNLTMWAAATNSGGVLAIGPGSPGFSGRLASTDNTWASATEDKVITSPTTTAQATFTASGSLTTTSEGFFTVTEGLHP